MPETDSKKRAYGIYFIPALVLLIALGIALFKALIPAPQMQWPPAMVSLTTVRQETIQITDHFVGLIEAKQHVEIKPRVKGFLINRPFVEGDMVKEGQLLFQIEPTQYEAELTAAKALVLAAEATLSRAEADYNRISGLYKKSTTTKADYDEYKAVFDTAKAKYLEAEAQVIRAELNLGYTDIKAPFDSKVSDSQFHVGSLIDPEVEQVLTTVVSLNPVLVSFGISDQTLKKYRSKNIPLPLGQTKVGIKLSADETYPQEGQLIFVDSQVNRKTDTIKFKASVENTDHVLVPGQMVVVELALGSERPHLLVPQKTVMTGPDGQRYVMLVDSEGKAAMSPVTVDTEYGSDYVVSAGLTAGQEIILDGLMYMGGTPLYPGMPVQVMPQSPDAGQASAPE